jgi:hypothetical protein
MKALRIALATATLTAGALLPLSAARAGGWAVTYLDPLPERIESGRTYTVGYWILQHGSHPYEGRLEDTGLKLVDAKNAAIVFPGVALREPAHFAAAVAVPRDGPWKLVGLQGLFAPYEIGTLTVPGRLDVLPPPAPMVSDGHQHQWNGVRPPVGDTVGGSAKVDVAQAADPPTRPAAQPQRIQLYAPGLLIGLGLVAGALAVLLAVKRRSSRPRADPPGGPV